MITFIADMTGQKPSAFFKMCWKYIGPLLSLVGIYFSDRKFSESVKMDQRFSSASQISLVLYLVYYKPLLVNNSYVYPDWAYALGWAMMLSSVSLVPLTAAGQMCRTAGTFRKVLGSRSLQRLIRSDLKYLQKRGWFENWLVFVFQRLSVLCRPSEDLVLRTTMERATGGHTPSAATEF